MLQKKDLQENNLRKSLNFGHTIGHALESALIEQNKDILHGEAVAAGMIMEAAITASLKLISKKELKEISDYLRFIYKKIKITKETESLLLKYILHDKKNEGDSLCFALPNKIGNYKLYCGVTIETIKKVIDNYQCKVKYNITYIFCVFLKIYIYDRDQMNYWTRKRVKKTRVQIRYKIPNKIK